MRVLDFSATLKPAQVQENLIAYMRLFAGLPGMAMVDDAETFWFVSGKPAPGDYVFRARWPEEGVEARIDGLLAEIGQHAERVDWMVFPDDRPADLGRRLEARGMPGGPGGNWLWADLAQLGDMPAAPDGFHVQRVRDDCGMAEWVRVSEMGFGVALGDFYAAYARHGYGPEAFSLHYTGYLGDTPVTSGTLLDAGGTASLYDISTPPEYRRQGFGSALTHFMLREIRSRGYAHTWIWSSSMAISVYQALGYVEATFGLHEHTWQKPAG